jgi:hypothetical protein
MPPVEKDEEGNELPVIDDRLERLEEATHKVYLLPADSTFTEPLKAKEGYAVCWNGKAWEYIEDHRRKRDMGGVVVEGSGTPYWMPGDDYQTPARYMKELGKLPEGAILEQPEKPEEIRLKELEEKYTSFVQRILDAEAQKLGYDNCNSVCTYVDTGVAKFDAEGVAFRKWRSAVWALGYELLAEVQAGTRPVPTEAELVELLPKLEIVYES